MCQSAYAHVQIKIQMKQFVLCKHIKLHMKDSIEKESKNFLTKGFFDLVIHLMDEDMGGYYFYSVLLSDNRQPIILFH